MAVASHELRPRGALAIFDSALHVCSQNAGVWALTLPSSALVVASLLILAESVRNQASSTLPALLFAASWMFRGISQGAASHHVEQSILAEQPLSVWASLRLALSRTPLFVIVSVLMAFVNILIIFTGGIGLFFVGPLLCVYTLCMRGNTPPLSLPSACHTQLGPTVAVARRIFWLFSVQLLVMLQIGVGVFFIINQSEALFSLDMSFLAQFLQHRSLILMASAVFLLFEPVRACVATLLLVDARVRKEGLDLLAQVERLPKRKSRVGAAAVTLLLCTLFWPIPARATEATDSIPRLQQLAEQCLENPEEYDELFQRIESTSLHDKASFGKLVSYLESLIEQDDGCERMVSALESAERLMMESSNASSQQLPNAQLRAKEILSRTQFSQVKNQASSENEGLNFWKWLLEWLEGLDADEKTEQVEVPTLALDGLANLFALLLVVVLAVVLIVFVVFRIAQGRNVNSSPNAEITVSESTDAVDALKRSSAAWSHQADQLAAEGRFREAVRSLYLALLAQFHQQGIIDYNVHFPNTQYLLKFNGAPEALMSFRDLTLRFDFAWYGHLGATADGFSYFRNRTHQLMSGPPPNEANHA